ncbi:MAG: HlyD family secretion protein [Caulobacterales bacterium]
MRDTADISTVEKPNVRQRFEALTKERAPLMIIGVAIILILFLLFLFLGGGTETTDNAYVQASRAPVSASIAGRIVEMRVHDNQIVEAGQTLFVLESDAAEADLQAAQAALSNARAHAAELKAEYASNVASYHAAQDALAFAKTQNVRERALQKEGLSAKQQVESSNFTTIDAQRNVERARQTMAASLAALGGDVNQSIDDFPQVREAAARVESAQVGVNHTVIKALQAGTVTRVDQVQVGSYVNAGQPLFWMVAGEPWVEANFKENQLENMRVGQEATVKVDAFPGEKLQARVMSFSPGTGAVFSAIPAQNATGNWVKVVQRLPVRLKLINPPADLPISAGLSAEVSVNTRSHGAALRGRE